MSMLTLGCNIFWYMACMDIEIRPTDLDFVVGKSRHTVLEPHVIGEFHAKAIGGHNEET